MVQAHAAKTRRIALVTGAARGIGLAIASRLAKDGLRVIAADVDGDALAAGTADLAACGLDVQARPLDICDRAAVAALMTDLGRVDVVVNNAGVPGRKLALPEIGDDALARVFNINLLGSFIVAQEGVRRMRQGGRVIHIASRAYLGDMGGAHYVASKAAVVGLTRAMAHELRWRGINVNAVAPGMTRTRMIDALPVQVQQALEGDEPFGRAAQPEDIAGVVAFLASPEAGFINGQVLMVDGGKTIGLPAL